MRLSGYVDNVAATKERRLTRFDPAKYGEVIGDEYDTLYPGVASETEAAVSYLAELARSRPEGAVLELAVGTGRLALGLHERGLRVAGIDVSDRMIEQLRKKSGGQVIEVVVGDYTDARVDGFFSVVVLAFNGILDPRGRQAQLAVFDNAARHLGPGGYFVVESFVLSEPQRSGDWFVSPRFVAPEHVELQLGRYDISTNEVRRTLVHLRPSGMHFVTATDSYASPQELDLMADVRGFDRVARYKNWARAEFTSTSGNHVSVYQLRGP